MRGSPLVQDLGREVYSVRPGDRADLGVHPHLRKERGITERGEHAFPLGEMGEIDIADQAVRERETQAVVAKNFHTADIAQQRDHSLRLRQRRNRGRHLMLGHERPVGKQLVLVERSPLENLAQHSWRQSAGQ